jgi:hypothetical protein
LRENNSSLAQESVTAISVKGESISAGGQIPLAASPCTHIETKLEKKEVKKQNGNITNRRTVSDACSEV